MQPMINTLLLGNNFISTGRYHITALMLTKVSISPTQTKRSFARRKTISKSLVTHNYRVVQCLSERVVDWRRLNHFTCTFMASN